MVDVTSEEELDLGQDEEVIEQTREQELSHLGLRDLQRLAKEKGLSGAGKSYELINRIVTFEETGIIPDGETFDLKPGFTASPPEPSVTAASQTPATAGVSAAPAVAGPIRRPAKQKTGFFENSNTFRAEFPVGPRGTIDDATHMQFIEDTHNAARAAGYRSLGAPHAGKRVGKSVMMVEGRPMQTVVYEVHARIEE